MVIVEDGTGKTDSNSYVSVSDATAYFTSRGFAKWSNLTETQKEVALIKATDYIDNVFDWCGTKKKKDQALSFPRVDLYDKDGFEVDSVPKQLQDAVCEACSLIASDTELYKTASENGAVTSENIGGKLSFTYDVSKKVTDSTLYESINYRLRGLFHDRSKARILSGKVRRRL